VNETMTIATHTQGASAAAACAGPPVRAGLPPRAGLPLRAGLPARVRLADWAGLADALRAEWTKLRTLPGTGWILAAICLLTIGVGAGTDAATRCATGASCAVDTTRVSLTGIEAGQAVVAVLAVLVISGEYSTGMITATFTAIPRRSVVLAAKALVMTGLVLAASVAAVAGSLVAGRLILAGNGLTPAHGLALVSLAHGPTVRAAVGSVLYLTLVGLLSLGIATIVRDSAAATGTVLGLLYIAPVIALFLGSSPVWQRRLERYSPVNAGLTIEDTTGLHHLPIGPWGGLAVLAIWAAASLVVAAVQLRLRDA
jgi:ABC-2 type transport system permease protein